MYLETGVSKSPLFAYIDSKECAKQRDTMNSWLWIILLWACCGRNSNCSNNSGCGNNSGCSNNSGSCCNNGNNNCSNSCGGNSNDGCGCDCDSGMIQPRTENDCGCEPLDLPYETFGCQENGVPCPPPIPVAFRR